MRKNVLNFVSIICLILCLFAGTMFSLNTNQTYAEEVFTRVTVSDNNFTMKMTADSRKNISLPKQIQTVESETGNVSYYCFKWRDLENLQFNFSADLSSETTTFSSYQFLVTNLQTDDLTSSFGVSEPTVLYEGSIYSNKFSEFTIYYYIDSDSQISESATTKKGNDFGLYKFDFNYTSTEDEVTRKVSIGEIYVAILPDDVDEIEPSNLKILYSVSSSNKLMNIFKLYLSNDSYKYVNPKYIQWNVVGIDKTNTEYVLSEKIKNDTPAYANYHYIWSAQSPVETFGTNFIFDSNDIEGTWTVFCTITNEDGVEKLKLTQNDLSTIKYQKPSYIWLIIVIIVVVFVLIAIITLIILKKKRDKIW